MSILPQARRSRTVDRYRNGRKHAQIGSPAGRVSARRRRSGAGSGLENQGDAAPISSTIFVAANRILADQGVVDGFGHVSARHDTDAGRFLLARSMAPGLVSADDILEFDLDGSAIEPRGRALYPKLM